MLNIPIEERFSDSPFVERIWHSRTEAAGTFTSIATNHWSLVVWEEDGQQRFSIRGPETVATSSPVPEDSESFGVIFQLGVYMPYLPVTKLVDTQIILPEATGKSVWLDGSAWETPTHDNVDIFIRRLIHENVLVQEPLIESALMDSVDDVSTRTLQRRFLHTTGISQNTILQIERARHATILLKSGMSILDTMVEAGYYDQPHLTRSLKRYIGQTPAQIIDPDRTKPLSFLYKTSILD